MNAEAAETMQAQEDLHKAEVPMSEILKRVNDAEDLDAAYIMSMVFNINLEANRSYKMRDNYHLTAEDIQACSRFLRHLLPDRSKLVRPTVKDITGAPAKVRQT